MTDYIPELVGYVASVLIMVSLTMKSILRLRLIGLVGNTAFLAYGILIGAVPIVITNAVIMGIQIFFLRRLLGKTEIFSLLKVRADSDYLRAFLEFHATEIQRFQPSYVFRPGTEARIWFILRDMLPAGLFIAEPQPDGSFEIVLDYAIPQYRDLKLGTWVYSGRSGMFAEDHPGTLWAKRWSDLHDRYLERMGFTPAEHDGESVFVLHIV